MRKAILGIISVAALTLGIIANTGTAKADTFDEIAMVENTNWCLTSDIHPQAGYIVFLYQCYDNVNQEFAWVPYDQSYDFLEYHIQDPQGFNLCLSDSGNGEGSSYVLERCTAPDLSEAFFASVNGNASGVTFGNAQTQDAIALDGNALGNYALIISWHFVYGAPYENMKFLGT